MKMIKCPNCGANTTNAQNCEYCGSLLVRFEDKGIDLAYSSYLNDTQTYPGIKNALELNLGLQKSNPFEGVVTDIFSKDGNDLVSLFCIIRSGYAKFMDGTIIPSNTEKGLCVIISFDYYTDNRSSEFVNWNQKEEGQHKKFKSLDIFSLFAEHICFHRENGDGDEQKSYEYFIDFGEDAVGAARLISKIMSEVFDLPLNAQIECYTNVGDAVNECRKRLLNKFSITKFFLVVGGISFTVFILCFAILHLKLMLSLSIASFIFSLCCFSGNWLIGIIEKNNK